LNESNEGEACRGLRGWGGLRPQRVPGDELLAMRAMQKFTLHFFRINSLGMEPGSTDNALFKTGVTSSKSSYIARDLGVPTVLPKNSEYSRFRLLGVKFVSALLYK